MGYAQPGTLFHMTVVARLPSPKEIEDDRRVEAWKQAERVKAEQVIFERATAEWRVNRFKT